jgi:hypothetical protein
MKVASGPDTHHSQEGPVTSSPRSVAATEQTISSYNLQKKTPKKTKPHYPPLSPERQLVISSKLQMAIRQKKREEPPPMQKQSEGFKKLDSFLESILKVYSHHIRFIVRLTLYPGFFISKYSPVSTVEHCPTSSKRAEVQTNRGGSSGK